MGKVPTQRLFRLSAGERICCKQNRHLTLYVHEGQSETSDIIMQIHKSFGLVRKREEETGFKGVAVSMQTRSFLPGQPGSGQI
jgi:hypothetical protein